MLRAAFSQIHFLPVIVATIVGFLFGGLWYSRLLFARPWMEELGQTEESMRASKDRVPYLLAASLLFTFLSTTGLALVITVFAFDTWVLGMEMGVVVGGLVVSARMLNGAIFEGCSSRLMRITIGHEIILFMLQGAILGGWR